MTKIATTAALLALAGCATLPAATPPPDVNEGMLVSAERLERRLGDNNLVVLHVGRDRAAYDDMHVPGARWLPLSSIVVERDGIPNELPPVEVLDSVFESVGVSDDSRVVIYGELGGLAAARAFFTLDYLGHPNVALLDGGLEAWTAERRPDRTEGPVAPRRGSFTPRPRADVVVSADWVREHLNDSTVVFIDARPEAEYRGTDPGAGITRPGHLPGAGHVFWRTALRGETDARLRSPDTVRAFWTLAGAEPGDTIVVYCRTGVQASHAYFQARWLGYDNVKMYDGSFIDWSRRGEGYPVER